MTKLERLHEDLHIAEISHSDDAGTTTSELRGLLRVCEAYVRYETDRLLYRFHPEENPWSKESEEKERKEAERKLEEMLG